MNIKNTMCKLSELSQWEIDSLVDNMPAGYFDFRIGEPCIGSTRAGVWGTWPWFENPKIVTYKEMMQLLKPKWTIYNNTLPWSDLSDKQKGKMLLAAHKGIGFGGTDKPTFNNQHYPYQAKEVKPEPTMAELFVIDWHETDVHLLKDFSEHMIAKGWVKKCK
jgi:hypothetical protein